VRRRSWVGLSCGCEGVGESALMEDSQDADDGSLGLAGWSRMSAVLLAVGVHCLGEL